MMQKAIKMLRCALVVLFLSYYAGSTLFVHTHFFNWGTVTHSHPFLPNSSHSHSQAECQTIEHLTDILFAPTALVAMAPMLYAFVTLFACRVNEIGSRQILNPSLRAPPAMSN